MQSGGVIPNLDQGSANPWVVRSPTELWTEAPSGTCARAIAAISVRVTANANRQLRLAPGGDFQSARPRIKAHISRNTGASFDVKTLCSM